LHAPWLDEFKKELLSFPKGRHDDQIDALSQGLQHAFAPKPSTAGWGIYGTVLCRMGGKNSAQVRLAEDDHLI
jgi:hypothetical protein